MSLPRRLSMTGRFSEGGLLSLLAMLSRDGEQAYIVGGAVRNALMGRAIDDIDIATSNMPQTVIEKATTAGLRVIPTGLAHGTVTVIVDDRPYEITTFREDIETDGRHALVRFGHDMKRDAERRDFTINALYMDSAGFIHDPVGGFADIEDGRVRFIGDPATRIREDYLRSLRFFRFTAHYAKGDIDEAALSAIESEREGLGALSRERVRQEIFKLVDAPRALYVLRIMARRNLIDPFFGVPLDIEGLWHTLERDPGADRLLRLAALAIHKKDDVQILREGLRLTNAETERLDRLAHVLIELSALPRPLKPRDIKALAFRHTRRITTDALVIDAGRRNVAIDRSLWEAAGSAPSSSPFTGAMMIKRGIPAGPVIGEIIRHVENNWAANDFTTNPERIAELISDAVARYSDRATS